MTDMMGMGGMGGGKSYTPPPSQPPVNPGKVPTFPAGTAPSNPGGTPRFTTPVVPSSNPAAPDLPTIAIQNQQNPTAMHMRRQQGPGFWQADIGE